MKGTKQKLPGLKLKKNVVEKETISYENAELWFEDPFQVIKSFVTSNYLVLAGANSG